MGDSALNKFKNIIQKQRAEKVHIMKFQTETKKNERSKTQLQYKNSLRQEYEKKIEEEKQMHLQFLSKRKELEAIESQLLQKISESQGLAYNLTPQSLSQHYYSTCDENFTNLSN